MAETETESRPEYEGKDLEEAIREAAAGQGIPEADLHYEIVEQGRRGVFGLGVKSVRIRVMPPIERHPAGAADREASAPSSPAPSGEHHGEVERTVRRMLELMGLELEVQSTPSPNGLILRLEGSDKKMLGQRNGELRSAIQFLLNRMARRAWPGVGRIQLAGNGRGGETRRRDEELVELVREVAQQVSRTGRTKKLHPMNGYERRLVHLTVREFPGLTTSSDGQGSLKRVRISKVKNQMR